ncbi:MAG: YoaP domain-containing protein [bacterium]
MRFKVLCTADEGFAGFIEYIPGKYAWRAVEADGYMVIHCIMLYRKRDKGKGYGSLLLKKCLEDAKDGNMRGVAVITSKGTWMAGKDLFEKNGFDLVDQAPPQFELLVRRFRENAPLPEFKADWGERLKSYRKGLTIICSDQCPYVAKSVREICETAHKRDGVKANLVELRDCKQAQKAPSAYGTFSMIYNGRLITDHPISNTRFTNIMDGAVK